MIHSFQQIVTGSSVLPESMVFSGGRDDRSVPIVFSFFYLRTDHRSILVDTSCFTMPGMELENPIPPDEALLSHGVHPEDVTDVVITHAHHDHIEGVRCFPQATFYMQADEYLHGGKACFPENARMVCFQHEYLLEDLRIKRIGGHSIGSCVAEFLFHGRQCVIGGDECYSYVNILRRIPTANPYCPVNASQFIETYARPEWLVLLPHQPLNSDSFIPESRRNKHGFPPF